MKSLIKKIFGKKRPLKGSKVDLNKTEEKSFDSFEYNIPLKLNKQEKMKYSTALGKLHFQNVSQIIEAYTTDYIEEEFPSNGSRTKGMSRKELFLYLLSPQEMYDTLLLSYHQALVENRPELVLKGLKTYNTLQWQRDKITELKQEIRLKTIFFCFAGNNLNIIDEYFPNESHLRKESYPIMNLIFALRNPIHKLEAINQANLFLEKKNTKFDELIIKCLMSIINNDPNSFSLFLANLTDLHQRQNWLHEFFNDLGKFLPLFSYGLYTIAFIHMDAKSFSSITLPKNKIFWPDFVEMNVRNKFIEEEPFIPFSNELAFLTD